MKDHVSNVEIGRRAEKSTIEENNFLRQKIIDLEKNYAVLNFEHDEMETKLKVIEKDKVSLEEELEESFAVSREFKKSGDKQKMYDTKISMLENKVKNGDVEIKTLKQDLESCLVLEETVIMLENTLELRDQKIYDLKEEIKQMEETSITKTCENCEKLSEQQIDVETHTNISHSEEDMPSTSKCRTCEYTSDDEQDLKVHIQTKHDLFNNTENYSRCPTSSVYEKVDKFEAEQIKCKKCDLTLKTEDKVKTHVCKVSIRNPSSGPLYMKGLYDRNGCTQIFNSKLNEEVAWLHAEICVLEECAPFRNVSKDDFEKVLVKDPVEHLKLELFVEDEIILWPKLIPEISPSLRQ